MSDSDDGPDPWDDRKRMRDDLRYKLNKLGDLFTLKGQPPRTFQARHARLLDSVIDTLCNAIVGENVSVALERLAQRDSAQPGIRAEAASTRRLAPGDPRPAEIQLADSLKAVQLERDQLLLGKRAGEKAMEDLKRRLADAEHRANSLPPAPTGSVAKLETLRERITGLNEEIGILKEERDDLAGKLASYTDVGSVEQFRTFAAIGSPEEISARESQVAVVAQSLVLLLRDYDRAIREYDAVIGPLMLGYDRRSRQLESFFRAVSNIAPLPADRPLSLPLAAVLSSLGAQGLPTTSAGEALQHVVATSDRQGCVEVEEGEIDAPSPNPMPPTQDQQLLEAVRTVIERQPFDVALLRGTLLDALASSPDDDLFTQLISSRTLGSTTSETNAISRASSELPASVTTRGDESASDPPAIDLTGSDASIVGSPQSTVRKSHREGPLVPLPSRAKGKRKEVSPGKGKSLKNVDFDRLRNSARLKFKQLETKARGRPWPLYPPQAWHFPVGIGRLRMVAWQLQLHMHEVKTPLPNEYEGIIQAVGGRYASVEEAVGLYEQEPWTVLENPPNPLTFDPSDPQFSGFYRATCNLYRMKMRPLWERANFLLIEPLKPPTKSSSAKEKERYKIRSQLSARRRKLNSDFTKPWSLHLDRIRQLFLDGHVDADFLLDPFLYWPPAFGVVPLVPPLDEEVDAFVDRLYRDEPSRLYFRSPKDTPRDQQPPSAAPQHPSAPHRSRLLMKFSDPKSPFSPSADQLALMAASKVPDALGQPSVKTRSPAKSKKKTQRGPRRIEESESENEEETDSLSTKSRGPVRTTRSSGRTTGDEETPADPEDEVDSDLDDIAEQFGQSGGDEDASSHGSDDDQEDQSGDEEIDRTSESSLPVSSTERKRPHQSVSPRTMGKRPRVNASASHQASTVSRPKATEARSSSKSSPSAKQSTSTR